MPALLSLYAIALGIIMLLLVYNIGPSNLDVCA